MIEEHASDIAFCCVRGMWDIFRAISGVRDFLASLISFHKAKVNTILGRVKEVFLISAYW